MKQNLKKYLERKHYENNSKYEKVQAKNIGRKNGKKKVVKMCMKGKKNMKKIPKIKKLEHNFGKIIQEKKSSITLECTVENQRSTHRFLLLYDNYEREIKGNRM